MADHSHAAIELEFGAVDFSGPGSVLDWRNVWLVLTIVRPFSIRCSARGTLVKELSVVMFRPVCLNPLHKRRDNVFPQIFRDVFPWLSP